MTSAPGLIRYAIRFTGSLPDAEDAYQRAMEIALTKAPVTDPARFMAWLRTVLRNEALAIVADRRREGPAAGEDAALLADRLVDRAQVVEARLHWRERYLVLHDALGTLTEAQRRCVMLQASGASYRAIEDITGFSRRKVERSILEGRAALAAMELRIALGEVCVRVVEDIDLVVTGTADARTRRRVRRHCRHCGACRAVLRDRRSSSEGMAALVPVGLIIAGTAELAPPDPGPAIAWLERLSAAATVRMGAVIEMALEAPGSLAAKVGAGAAVAVVAGGAGIPVVHQRLSGPGERPPVRTASDPTVAAATVPPRTVAAPAMPAPATASPADGPPRPAAAPRVRPTPTPASSVSARRRPPASAAPHPAPTRPVPHGRPVVVAVTHRVTAPARVQTPASTPAPPVPPASRPPTGAAADAAGAHGISLGP